VFLIGWVCFREQPTVRDWVLLVFAAIGVAIILRAELWGASPIGVRYGLASGLFFALVVVTLKWNRDLDSAWLIFLNHAVTALVFAPALVQHGVYPAGWQWAYLFAFGVFQLGLPYILFAMALKSVSSHEASGLTLLEPLLVPVWVYVAWRSSPEYQFPAATTLIGGGLILAGLLIRYLGARQLGARKLGERK
jgi:drug/metabolite transporter (DMT)-like permease